MIVSIINLRSSSLIIVSSNIKIRLYKAFTMPYFLYCSGAWHFCGVRNSDKLQSLNKLAFRIILDDNHNTYETFLKKLDITSLETRRI